MPGNLRLEQILQHIIHLANGDFEKRSVLSDKGDEYDAILAGLNLLAEELGAKDQFILENKRKVNAIMEALIRSTQLDFSQKMKISERGDEFDAIALGINTMCEELETHILQLETSRQEIRHTLHQLTEAQHLAHIGSWEWNVPTNTIEWSDELYRIYGRERGNFETTFNTYMNFIHPADSDRVNEIIQDAFREKKSFTFDHRIIQPDGNERFLDCKGEVYLDDKGAVIRMTGTAQDVTEKKIAEEKLRNYTLVLEQKNKETEQFAYVASHDLQEPLRTITNYIGLFEEDYEGKMDEDANMYLQFIKGAASRMKVLISDLLEYTRIENDKDKVSVDCNKLVRDILQDMHASITETNATVQYGSLPVVIGYYSRLKSLFQNLISNAIKFRKKDEPPVVKIEVQDRDKEWLFSISDNGIGIDKVYGEKIFLLFQRLHTRAEYQGTGIGLAHCKKIVELRGGRIWVESEPGVGSTFYFTIPKTI
jgi:PAS domain S-box-containing protein